ncbi:hypothetical protein [Actinoplanes sp. M2I2]|uniref:hypothetical protein n=1 Tax=Actinoplanes sp. M2I2 TaxID=1734444 RepID=UPI002021C17A|nr:hypothetical protein [Actinoplanes sp. M2I2]
MRSLHALLRALRTRRNRNPARPIDASHPSGTDHPGLADLLEAARAPATPEELAGETEAVAAFVAHRRRAARSERRHRTHARIRAVLVPVTAGLALLILAGTAVAARTGNLPQDAQQHAHRLFSALGVPAPRTGAPNPTTPGSSRPRPRPSHQVIELGWCQAWGAPDRPLSREDRRKLSAAAGGEDGIAKYCRDLHRKASAEPAPSSASPGPGPSAPEAPPLSEPPSPTTTPEASQTVQPGRAPTAPPSSRPTKTPNTHKPTKTPKETGPPSKSRGPSKKAERHNAVSPTVATPTPGDAQRDGIE